MPQTCKNIKATISNVGCRNISRLDRRFTMYNKSDVTAAAATETINCHAEWPMSSSCGLYKISPKLSPADMNVNWTAYV